MKLLTGLLGLSAANANQCCDYIKVNGNGNLHKMNAIFKRHTNQNSETGTPKYERVNEYGEYDQTGQAWASRERIDYYNHKPEPDSQESITEVKKQFGKIYPI